MDRQHILNEIDLIEGKLVAVSERIKEARSYDSLEAWLTHIIKDDQEIAKLFLIPTDKQIRKAILILISKSSSVTQPLVTLLATRIASFISTTIDFNSHPMRGLQTEQIINNLNSLVDLTEKYDSYYQSVKSIDLVSQALKRGRLHIYKSFNWEPDLRVVLQTLQMDKNRDNVDAVTTLTNFIFEQLKDNLSKRGAISYPRHAWWAFKDLLSESSNDWIKQNENMINSILKNLIEDTEYDIPTSALKKYVPELNTSYYERIWVTINAIKIYKSKNREFITSTNMNELKKRIDIELKAIMISYTDGSIRSILCKLLLLYEIIGYLEYIDTIYMCEQKAINIAHNRIGRNYYCDIIFSQYHKIKEGITNLISSRHKWTRYNLSSMLISGSAGQGKSELIEQILSEIKDISQERGMDFHQEKYFIGTEIKSDEDLSKVLSTIKAQAKNPKMVRVVIFDEFDKAEFDFYGPFLPFLEAKTQDDESITFYIFAQSTYASYKIFENKASSLPKKSQRDFLTRLQLGYIDMPELRSSGQQKIFTVIGHYLRRYPDVEHISKNCIWFYAHKGSFNNIRDLLNHCSHNCEIINNVICLKTEIIGVPNFDDAVMIGKM
ncbi:hypothetical protein [Desulfosporosinus sp.]|uniref:hypothetical protein n=1 Tax=Desulfosporosinus sp. TaxID=157907 RepID=UPI00261BF123|nr:hypothetical protein [Desulfosporosinus sp.]